MRRFRYPLARLERLRNHEERLARRQLAQSLAQATEVKSRLDVATDNLQVAAAENGVASGLGRALEVGMRSMIVNLQHSLAAAEQVVQQARIKYGEARQGAETLRRLRESRYQEWLAESMREEQQELEESDRARRAFAGVQAEETR